MGRSQQETQRPAARRSGFGFWPQFLDCPDSYRPLDVYAAHGYGPMLLAGAEITQLLKQHPYGINDTSVQIVK